MWFSLLMKTYSIILRLIEKGLRLQMIVVLLQGVAVSKEGNLRQPREHLQLHVRQRSFRIFMKTKSFLGTNQFSMTTSGIEHMDGIWSGRIFSTYVHQASHLISCFDIKIGRDLILVFETLFCIARFLSWSGRSFSAQKITNRQR